MNRFGWWMGQLRRDAALLVGLSLVVRLAVAAFISRPGYMDPSYYAAGAVNLARGGGLDEPYLWNYLGDPAGLPHPGFLYWMPLPSFLAAPLAALFPGSFFALQVPFVVLSALLPLIGYGVAWHATGRRRSAWIAGLLVLFSGFFFPYWTLPETFAPFALLGSVALWLAGGKWQAASGKWQAASGKWQVASGKWQVASGKWQVASGKGWMGVLVGGLVGLVHLTRADGFLLLPVVVFVPLLFPSFTRPGSRITHHASRRALRLGLFILLGYLLAMGPWFARNLVVIGAPLAVGGTKTLWLTSYDDLYCYGCELTPQSYLAWGWGNVLRSKLDAAWVNLQRFLAEDCLVFLLPFVVVGFYRLRRLPAFVSSLVYLLLAYLAHSLAFTFPGPRGGFFHASSAVLPFLFTAGVEGLEAAVEWLGHRRRWNLREAQAVFGWAAAAAAAALSLYVAVPVLRGWQGVDRAYQEVGGWMEQRGVREDAVVMVNNPPSFWCHARRPAVVVPTPAGDVDVLLAAADRYGVSYVVLDRNWPLRPGQALPSRLRLVAAFGEGEPVHLYELGR